MTKLSQDQARDALRLMHKERFDMELKEWDQFASLFRLHNYDEGDHWIKAGDIAQDTCFIATGLFRVYYIDQAGNEVNQNFYQTNEMIAPVSVMISNEPCQYYVQALEPCQVLLANFSDLYEAGKDNAQWLRLENKILQTVFLKTAKREAKLLLGNGEQRYKWFLKEYPELAEKLPQYHIASFLGLTPVSLSRLRKKVGGIV